MDEFSLTHLSDENVVVGLTGSVARERADGARVLAHIAEFDARRLYLPLAYPSSYAYCVGRLRMSDDEAYNRIRAARTAREFPAIFQALAEDRLHLSAVLVLAPHFTHENAEELLAAAAHRSKSEIQRWLAGRFPRPDLPAEVHSPSPELVPERVGASSGELVPERVETLDQKPAATPTPRVAPLSAERFGVQFTMGSRVHDKLRHLEALLGQRVRDFEETFELGLDARIRAIEKRRYATTDRPHRGRRGSSNPARYVQAGVKRAVRERDGGRCTFMGASGHRCEARSRLEFDHVTPVAHGGLATVDNLRLRCRAHNQYAAEQAFGAEFMRGKRDAARGRSIETDQRDVVPWLVALGLRATDAGRAAAHCERLPEDVALEDRVKAALRFLTPAHRLPKKPDEIAA